jgi:hypothetical protein
MLQLNPHIHLYIHPSLVLPVILFLPAFSLPSPTFCPFLTLFQLRPLLLNFLSLLSILSLFLLQCLNVKIFRSEYARHRFNQQRQKVHEAAHTKATAVQTCCTMTYINHDINDSVVQNKARPALQVSVY